MVELATKEASSERNSQTHSTGMATTTNPQRGKSICLREMRKLESLGSRLKQLNKKKAAGSNPKNKTK